MQNKTGVVLERGNGHITVLMDNGEFRNIKTRKSYNTGEIYLHNPTPKYGKYATAAALFIVMLFGIIDFFNVVAYARVSSGVDIGVNRWNRVVAVDVYAPDGKKIIDEVNLKGKTLEDAVDIVIERSIDRAEDEMITVEVETKNKNSSKNEKMLNTLKQSIGNSGYHRNGFIPSQKGKTLEIQIKANVANEHPNNMSAPIKDIPPGQIKDVPEKNKGNTAVKKNEEQKAKSDNFQEDLKGKSQVNNKDNNINFNNGNKSNNIINQDNNKTTKEPKVKMEKPSKEVKDQKNNKSDKNIENNGMKNKK